MMVETVSESLAEMFKGNKSKYGTDDTEELDNAPAPTIAGDPDAHKKAQKKKKKPYMFPYWCNYIAWICKSYRVFFVVCLFVVVVLFYLFVCCFVCCCLLFVFLMISCCNILN